MFVITGLSDLNNKQTSNISLFLTITSVLCCGVYHFGIRVLIHAF